MSRATGYPRAWAALVVALRMRTGSGLRIIASAIMDRASQALAEVFSTGESAPYRAVSERSSVPRSAMYNNQTS
jgi:hypothetical protein